MQVASRLWIVWGVIHPVQKPTTTDAITLASLPNGMSLQLSLVTLLFAWSVTEVIRYGFFAVKVRTRLSGGAGSACVRVPLLCFAKPF